MRASRFPLVLVLAACLPPVAALAFGLSDDVPPNNIVNCQAGPGDVEVTSFADVLTYHIKGMCKMEFMRIKGAWVPAGPYEVVATWKPAEYGPYHEKINGPQSIGENSLVPQHGPWEMELGGTCKLDPFIAGPDASTCVGRMISSTNALYKISTKQFPVTPRLIPASLRPSLTAKALQAIHAEHQAPTFLKPEEGKTYKGDVPVNIDAGPGSPTEGFRVEWQYRAGEPGNPAGGPWTDIPTYSAGESKPSFPMPETAFLGHVAWRIRARAYQTKQASWSEWRTFTVHATPPCGPTSPYGAKYDAGATPSTLAAGKSTTVQITVTNTGTKTWTTGKYHLAYHWVQGATTVVFDGQRTALDVPIEPCGGEVLSAALVAPSVPGTYTLQWDMVEENVTWFSSKGVPTGNRTVVISSSVAPQSSPAPKK